MAEALLETIRNQRGVGLRERDPWKQQAHEWMMTKALSGLDEAPKKDPSYRVYFRVRANGLFEVPLRILLDWRQ